MSEHTTKLTSREELDEIMSPGAERTALIDFRAPWCKPCEEMAPAYEAVAEEMKDEPLEFLRVDTQQTPELSAPFHIRSIPTLVLVHDGDIVETTVGGLDADQIRERAERLLAESGSRGWLDWLLE